MSKMLINGILSDKPKFPDGTFRRETSEFRGKITHLGGGGFKAESGRYHLYTSLACPWSHRTTIMRELKGLQEIISMSGMHYFMGDEGWAFEAKDKSTVDKDRYLSEVYLQSDPQYTGNITVPVLWDKRNNYIVSNDSEDIMRMFNSEFEILTSTDKNRSITSKIDYYPSQLQEEIDAINDFVYLQISNKLYQVGFADNQITYDLSVRELFSSLDALEKRLSRQSFLIGNSITEADWRLFPTLLRFDIVYHTHFKANLRRLSDYQNISNYLMALIHVPGIAGTVDFEHIKKHYYLSHRHLNPRGIVPLGPETSLRVPVTNDQL